MKCANPIEPCEQPASVWVHRANREPRAMCQAHGVQAQRIARDHDLAPVELVLIRARIFASEYPPESGCWQWWFESPAGLVAHCETFAHAIERLDWWLAMRRRGA